MTAMAGTMKRGDLLPVLVAMFRYVDNGQSLSNAIPIGTTTVFTMRLPGNPTPLIDRATANVTASSAGVVTIEYEWAAGDTDRPGVYACEFECDLSGSPLTLPTKGYIEWTIEDDLG